MAQAVAPDPLPAVAPDPAPTVAPDPLPAVAPDPAQAAAPDPLPTVAPGAGVAAPSFVDDAHVRWRLEAQPARLSMRARRSFRLRIFATNEGETTVNPESGVGSYGLNGEPHLGLNLWFGNGTRVREWMALPPGRTVSDERSEIGADLFPAPGTYRITYTRGSQSALVRVVVTR